MVHVALLRGVNVGGANKVEMRALRAALERAGMRSVRTYINSGNVVFSTSMRSLERIARKVESVIAGEFGLEIGVLVLRDRVMNEIVGALPAGWTTDAATQCDVMFLWPEVDRPSVLGDLVVVDGVDDVRYVPGAVLWRVDRAAVTRSGRMRLAGSALYRHMTVRNCNTARRLLAMTQA